ncbi:hypothetical protein [Endothiovibrio diazotrophicus]
MPTLLTDDLTSGMVLEQDVKDRSGRLLVRAGVALTERSLKVLRTWGIAEVTVQEDEQTRQRDAVEHPHPLAAADPELVTRGMAHAEQLFRHVDMNHPAAAALASLVVERFVKHNAGAGHGR